MPVTTRSSKSRKCDLLDAPPELRNAIYELVFEPDVTEEVEFLFAEPPSKALALTCRQIYEEARLVHRAAYRRFWRETKFTITLPCVEDNRVNNEYFDFVRAELHEMDDDDVGNINFLRVGYYEDEWVLEEKVWRVDNVDVRDKMFLMPLQNFEELKALGYYVSKCPEFTRADLDGFDGELTDIEPAKKLLKGRTITIEEVDHFVEQYKPWMKW